MGNNKTLIIVVFVLAGMTAIVIGVAATLWLTRDSPQAGETAHWAGRLLCVGHLVPRPLPLPNVALQQSRQRGGGDSGYRYRDSLSGTSAGSEGNCTWINVPGSGSAMSSRC